MSLAPFGAGDMAREPIAVYIPRRKARKKEKEKTIMKKLLTLALALCMVLALAVPALAADGSVYWLNFKPESDEALQEIAAMYTEETGVPVKVVTAASGTYSQTLTAEMDKSNPPTMFVVGNANSVKDWTDYVIDLAGTPIAEELNTDAYNLYDDEGKLCSIGYCFECYGIIVNPDLIEAAGHSMDELVNFEGLKAVAEDIHARADELGFDAFTSNDMDSSSSWRYTGHMINLEYYYEEQAAGEKWTECPPELTGEFMDNFRALYDLAVENSTVARTDLATGGHDAEAEFKEAKAAFFVNGSWEYSITKTTKQPTQYEGTITVPFSPETQLSGLSVKVGPNDYLWYRRVFRLPESFAGNKVILHFGAVDQEADVWVNGFHVASHIGGYLPFEAEVSESLLGGLEVEITVRVRDASDIKNYHTRGKQKLKRGGIWYTAQSGIWQTVWMEAVPASGYIRSLKIDPIYDSSCVFINADCEGDDIKPVAVFEGNSYELPARIPVPDFIPWSPETPQPQAHVSGPFAWSSALRSTNIY